MESLPSAELSEDRAYRYVLRRAVGANPRTVNFIMLNPSTADELENDPTIRRCRGFAEGWEFGRLVVTNLFAFRSTDPKLLRRVTDPIGPDNDARLVEEARRADLVVCAWGTKGNLHGRDNRVKAILQQAKTPLHCLRLTKTGFPGHPLYLEKRLMPSRWH